MRSPSSKKKPDGIAAIFSHIFCLFGMGGFLRSTLLFSDITMRWAKPSQKLTILFFFSLFWISSLLLSLSPKVFHDMMISSHRAGCGLIARNRCPLAPVWLPSPDPFPPEMFTYHLGVFGRAVCWSGWKWWGATRQNGGQQDKGVWS